MFDGTINGHFLGFGDPFRRHIATAQRRNSTTFKNILKISAKISLPTFISWSNANALGIQEYISYQIAAANTQSVRNSFEGRGICSRSERDDELAKKPGFKQGKELSDIKSIIDAYWNLQDFIGRRMRNGG